MNNPTIKISLLCVAATLLLSSCRFFNFYKEANDKFADQHFKTAIAHIELFNTRHGHYPGSLDSLEFMGEWDAAIFQGIEYEKLDTEYRLNSKNSVLAGSNTSLSYPNEFWQGLGIKKSNVKN